MSKSRLPRHFGLNVHNDLKLKPVPSLGLDIL
jgi:hypothetical protein